MWGGLTGGGPPRRRQAGAPIFSDPATYAHTTGASYYRHLRAHFALPDAVLDALAAAAAAAA